MKIRRFVVTMATADRDDDLKWPEEIKECILGFADGTIGHMRVDALKTHAIDIPDPNHDTPSEAAPEVWDLKNEAWTDVSIGHVDRLALPMLQRLVALFR